MTHRAITKIAAALFICAVTIALYRALLPSPLSLGAAEPDRYYHLAISRQFATEGIVRSVPQLEDLGWDKYFPDKEFLFHALGGIAYRLGGERGTLALIPILGVLITLSLFFLSTTFVEPLYACVLVMGVVFLNPTFMNRMFLLRPHLLAVLLFIWILYGIAQAKPWFTCAFCALYCLGYHGFYLPIAALLIGAMPLSVGEAGFKLKGKKVLWAGLAGVGAGILCNPYFPSNLASSWMVVGIALGGGLPKLLRANLGTELVPPPSTEFIALHGVVLVFVILGFFMPKRDHPRAGLLLRSMLLMAVLLAVTGISPRGNEYLVPATVLALSVLLSTSRQVWKLFGAVMAMLVVARAVPSVDFYREVFNTPFQGIRGQVADALDQLPSGETGKKIYNCNWSLGSFILYRRPAYRFVELLDPTYLYTASRTSWNIANQIDRAEFPDMYLGIRRIFDSNYVLCDIPAVDHALDIDPDFRRIYPSPGDTPGNTNSEGLALYAVSDQPDPAFVRTYEAKNNSSNTWRKVESDLPDELRLRPAPILDLNHSAKATLEGASELSPEGLNCLRLRPSAEDLLRGRGAELLGIGGRSVVETTFNGHPLLRPWGGSELDLESGSLRLLVPLPHPLKPEDRLEVLVCGSSVALSFWKRGDLESRCPSQRIFENAGTSYFEPSPSVCRWKLAYPAR